MRSIPQPPSGGCVLKPSNATSHGCFYGPAAFGRLCVETANVYQSIPDGAPAAFGRLCVETVNMLAATSYVAGQPPSGGCVLKQSEDRERLTSITPAAFGRLCVETIRGLNPANDTNCQPPSGGCVLKPQTITSQYPMAPSRLRAAVC